MYHTIRLNFWPNKYVKGSDWNAVIVFNQRILDLRRDTLFIMNELLLTKYKFRMSWTGVRTKQLAVVINTDVLGLPLRVGVCRTIVPPNHTNMVNRSSRLKITTPETTGIQQTQHEPQRTHVQMKGDRVIRALWTHAGTLPWTCPSLFRSWLCVSWWGWEGNSYCFIVFSSRVQVHEHSAFLFPSSTS